jgi:hypothetical protein
MSATTWLPDGNPTSLGSLIVTQARGSTLILFMPNPDIGTEHACTSYPGTALTTGVALETGT